MYGPDYIVDCCFPGKRAKPLEREAPKSKKSSINGECYLPEILVVASNPKNVAWRGRTHL